MPCKRKWRKVNVNRACIIHVPPQVNIVSETLSWYLLISSGSKLAGNSFPFTYILQTEKKQYSKLSLFFV